MRLGDLDALLKEVRENKELYESERVYLEGLLLNAPTVELDESVIQEVLDKRCMTVVANEYLIALHGKGPQGKWIFHKDLNESCRYGCNQCGNLNNIPSNFCPNCGARMVKK